LCTTRFTASECQAFAKASAGNTPSFPFVLGLSATPDRAYDDDGNAFIEKEIGPSIFRFPLEAAIARGILCEFDYTPLDYDLTEGDRQRLQQVYSRKAASAHGGTPMSDEDVWIELSKVYKTAEMKPQVFASYVAANPQSLRRSIVFVETREYGERVLQTIHDHTNLYRTYYSEDEGAHLQRFSRGEIDCLITCHRISQGIDIKALRSVFLLSSARAKLETVQRIGRCLRTDPNDPAKRALVVDFVRPQDEDTDQPNADIDRRDWLANIALTRKGDPIEP
jgi:superfamily II DNA or RNA helicase